VWGMLCLYYGKTIERMVITGLAMKKNFANLDQLLVANEITMPTNTEKKKSTEIIEKNVIINKSPFV
jgi:hypothetical protein